MKKQSIGTCILGLVFGLGGLVQAKTIYVDLSSGSPQEPYTNVVNASHTIQPAIDVAEDGDEVMIYPGTYTPSAQLVVTNNIYLRGLTLSLEHADAYIIDAQNAHAGIDLDTNDCEVIGLTIQNANGEGIHCENSAPLVWNCIIANTDGNGMYKGSASGCIFTNNSGYYGGGARGTVVEYSEFTDNSAQLGGGLYGGTAYRCTFQNNTAVSGGGISGSASATNCVFIKNTATSGGGAANSATLSQCALTENSAGTQGGGSYLSTLRNCTLTKNNAFTGGGGMYGGTAYNTILWDNTSITRDNNFNGGTQLHFSCAPEATPGSNGCITNNPQLVSFSHISSTSPCIGAGNSNDLVFCCDIDIQSWNSVPAIGCDEVKTSVTGDLSPVLTAPEHVAAEQPIYFSAYVEGATTQTILDFGDGSAVTNPIGTEVSHPFSIGNYWVVLTGYNDDNPGGVAVSNLVVSRSDSAHTIYVSAQAFDDSEDGESWAMAKQTIQAGIDAQNLAGGLVLVSNGTYNITSEIFVNKQVRIQGLDGAEHTTVAGNNNQRCFTLFNSHCILKDLTLRDGGGYGEGTSGGGAIYCTGSNPLVESCILTQNNTGNGGGAMLRGTATNCVFSYNTGGNGPGGMQYGIAIDCLFEDNESGNGAGGIQNGFATRCIFRKNRGTYGGGARDSNVFDCQFLFNEGIPNYRGNTAPGGGMYGGTAENCVFRGNKSLRSGGGTSGTTATHCTYTANQAATVGGGSDGGTLDHCIVWYNTALDAIDNIAYGTVTDSCSPDLEHGVSGNITNNPQLVSASHISPASPCAGSGTIPRDTLDIDGENWRSSPAMGCDEPRLPYSADAISISVEGPTDILEDYKAFFTVDIQGAFYRDYVEFGDGQTGIHSATVPISHMWNSPGSYEMVISAYDQNSQLLLAVTNTITVRTSDFNTLYVAPDGNDSSDGRSWATAKQTIQAAIDAQDFLGGKVMVSNGVYNLGQSIIIDKALQLVSLNGAEATMIDGGSTNKYTGVGCLKIEDVHATVTGFTFQNGNDRDSTDYYAGGGIYCDHSRAPVVKNCNFLNDSATTGGGMTYGTAIDCVFSNCYCESGSGGGLYLGEAQDCQFIENSSRDGGGGMYGGKAYGCSFSKNTGGAGAGMYGGEANDCTFNQNSTTGSGGGMIGGEANDCTFIQNESDQAGGGMKDGTANRCAFIGNRSIENSGGGMSHGIANSCTFTGNSAYLDGGATSYTTLNNCTVAGNSAGSKAGGCFAGNVNNSIVWNNTAVESDQDLYSAHPLHTCSPDAPHGTDSCITNNPLLLSASHLSAASPCIGAGDATLAPETDIDGEAWNTPPAMGCDEIGATLSGAVEMAFYGPSPIRASTYGDYFALFDGQVSKTIVDFGHGTPLTNAVGMIHHGWPGPASGNYQVILTAFNDDYPQGTSFTQTVEAVGSSSDIYVRMFDGSNMNDGSSWTNAKQTIQAGIDAQTVYNGIVWVDGANYSVLSPIIINKMIRLISVDSGDIHGGGSQAILDAGGTERCFDIDAVHCTIDNFILQHGATSTAGYSEDVGGGIRCKTTDPVIRNSTIRNCISYSGGGVYKGTLDNCVLSNNVAASRGGAVSHSIVWNSTITSNSATSYGGGAEDSQIGNSTLSSNTTANGGAVYNSTLTNCTLFANMATSTGGAGRNSTFDACTITSNSAPSGGGLYQCTADRCVISTNNATVQYGGGLYYGTAQNCTIYYNRATQRGGGSYGSTLRNCTVASNVSDEGGGAYGGYIYNSILWDNFAWGSGSNIGGSSTPRNSCYPEADPNNTYYNNITNNPQFVSYPPGFFIRGSDYYLSNLSPCLNAGDNAQVQTDRDFNGWTRIIYGTVDMGACEMYFFDADTDGDDMPDGWELENFGGSTNAVATADADGDRFDNRSEYIAGTLPHDDTSYLHIVSSEIVGSGLYTALQLEWSPSVEGRTYGISWSTNLVEGFQDKGISMPYPATNTSISIGDTTNAFYQINVQLD